MTADATKPKRGRPPLLIPCSGSTKKTLAELGITRSLAARCIALASMPKDMFEAELNRTGRPSVARMINVARGRPPNHRHGRRLTEAIAAAQQLTPAELRMLCVAILTADDAAHVYADLVALRVEVTP